jgi:hypothetical protein
MTKQEYAEWVNKWASGVELECEYIHLPHDFITIRKNEFPCYTGELNIREKNLDIDYDFTICTQKVYLQKQGLL